MAMLQSCGGYRGESKALAVEFSVNAHYGHYPRPCLRYRLALLFMLQYAGGERAIDE